MKLGIYGGTFNPVHLGHLLVAHAAMEEMALDKLFFVPAAQSPFKTENEIAPAQIRLQWLRLALAGKINCEIDEQEIRRGGISYAIETVRNYAKRFPKAKLFYLIGADNVVTLNKWKEPEELAKLVEFVVIPRPGETVVEFPKPFHGKMLRGFPLAISSSQIRDRIKVGLPIENLVPLFVADAIRTAKIYV